MKLRFVITCLLFISAVLQAQNKYGAYVTLDDYRNDKITDIGDDISVKTSFLPKFLVGPYYSIIKVKDKTGKKRSIKAKSLDYWGIRDANGVVYKLRRHQCLEMILEGPVYYYVFNGDVSRNSTGEVRSISWYHGSGTKFYGQKGLDGELISMLGTIKKLYMLIDDDKEFLEETKNNIPFFSTQTNEEMYFGILKSYNEKNKLKP